MGLMIDILLALAAVALAWRVLVARQAFAAIVLFIMYGVMMAIIWVRLEAPDVALAEAAIGAGLTGALLLEAIGYIQSPRRAERKTHER